MEVQPHTNGMGQDFAIPLGDQGPALPHPQRLDLKPFDLGFLIVGRAAGWPVWLAIASVGAWINIFNLLPVWQLDGGRAWNALSRRERAWASAALWLLAILAGDGLFFIIAIAGSLRAFSGRAPEQGDRGALVWYVGVAAALTLIMRLAHGSMP